MHILPIRGTEAVFTFENIQAYPAQLVYVGMINTRNEPDLQNYFCIKLILLQIYEINMR